MKESTGILLSYIREFFVYPFKNIKKIWHIALIVISIYIVIEFSISNYINNLLVSLLMNFYMNFGDMIASYSISLANITGKKGTELSLTVFRGSPLALIPVHMVAYFPIIILILFFCFFALPASLIVSFLHPFLSLAENILVVLISFPILDPLLFFLFSKFMKKSEDKKNDSFVKSVLFIFKERIKFLCMEICLLIPLFILVFSTGFSFIACILLVFFIIVFQGLYYLSFPFFYRKVKTGGLFAYYVKNFPVLLVFSIFSSVDVLILYLFLMNSSLWDLFFIYYPVSAVMKTLGIMTAFRIGSDESLSFSPERKPSPANKFGNALKSATGFFKAAVSTLSVAVVIILALTLFQMAAFFSEKIPLLYCGYSISNISLDGKRLDADKKETDDKKSEKTLLSSFTEELSKSDLDDVTNALMMVNKILNGSQIAADLVINNTGEQKIVMDRMKFVIKINGQEYLNTNLDNITIGVHENKTIPISIKMDPDLLRKSVEGENLNVACVLFIDLDLWFGKFTLPINFMNQG